MKRTRTTLRCAAAVVAMAACGGKKHEPTPDPTGASGSESTKEPAPPTTPNKIAWLVHGSGGSTDQFGRLVSVGANGEVAAAGDFEGALELGGKQVSTQESSDAWVASFAADGSVRWLQSFGRKGRDYAMALSGRPDGTLVFVLRSNEEPRAQRIELAPDGKPTTTVLPMEYKNFDGAVVHADGSVVTASRVVEPVTLTNKACAASPYAVQRFGADGKPAWTQCTESDKDLLPTDAMNLAAAPEGGTVVCGGFNGPMAWAGNAAPALSEPAERAFILALDAAGKVRWVQYVPSQQGSIECTALSASDDGSVAAVVYGTAPGSALMTWGADGSPRWSRSCKELLGTADDDCELESVTATGSDLVVAAGAGSTTIVATLDGKTGASKQKRTLGSRVKLKGLAARGGTIAFTTTFHDELDLGTGSLKAEGGDVVVGRL